MTSDLASSPVRLCHCGSAITDGTQATCNLAGCVREVALGRAEPTPLPAREGPYARVLPDAAARWLGDKLASIVRRGAKHGLACALSVEVSEPWTEWQLKQGCTRAAADKCGWCAESRAEGLPGCEEHYEAGLWAEVKVDGTLPTVNGFALLGALDFEGGEILVRTAPGREVPASYFAPGRRPSCDHCSANRARKTVYVLQDAGGQTVQVGAQCLAEYVRSADAQRCADLLASMYSAASGAEDDEEEIGRFRRADPRRPLVAHLATYVAVARHCRRYVSKAQAERTSSESTASIVATLQEGTEHELRELRRAYGDIKVAPADVVFAERAIAWARESFPADAACSSFEHDMGAIARLGYVTPKTRGTGGYIGEAYKRTLAPAEAKPAPARHLAAAVGERVTFDCEVVRTSSYDSMWGTTFVTVMRKVARGTASGEPLQAGPDDGAIVTWKSKECPMARAAIGSTGEEEWGKGGWQAAGVGARLTVCATVKAHGNYKGSPQTEVSRLTQVCDGWGYVAEAGTPEAELSARMIAEGRNRPAPKVKKPRARKPKKAAQADHV